MTEQTSTQSSTTTWFVGASFGHTDDQSARFFEEGIWQVSVQSTHLEGPHAAHLFTPLGSRP
ncbi:MAG: hypothetical protein EKK45_22345 [Curvibacter sp.]|nr:MAG: hypothetical protein EKK45_22345 [Curvibacter sp.]